MFNNDMYYLATNIKFNDLPKTIKIPTCLDNEQDRITGVRAWLFYYQHIDYDMIKLDISQEYFQLNHQEQPFYADSADIIANQMVDNNTDSNYIEYTLSCHYPKNLIVNIDYNCIKYFSPSSMYKTDDDIIGQEIYENLMCYMPIAIYLSPVE